MTAPDPTLMARLTPAERAIAAVMLQGLTTNKEIAGRLGKNPCTIQVQINTMRRRLQVGRCAALVTALMPPGNGPAQPPVLTARQEALARPLCGGHSNKEIARALGLTPDQVRNGLKHLYRTLDVHSRTEAARRLGQLGVTAHPRRTSRRTKPMLPDPAQTLTRTQRDLLRLLAEGHSLYHRRRLIGKIRRGATVEELYRSYGPYGIDGLPDRCWNPNTVEPLLRAHHIAALPPEGDRQSFTVTDGGIDALKGRRPVGERVDA